MQRKAWDRLGQHHKRAYILLLISARSSAEREPFELVPGYREIEMTFLLGVG
jgi:hypothetical protein